MWDPGQYERFAGPRLRPALELLARVPLEAAESIVDLGCGTGTAFAALRARYPGAHLTGVDSSPEMLAKAVGADALTLADAAEWTPHEPVDLVFSNAALHWLGGHASVLPRLVGTVRPGGILAVQMPRNHDRPSHRLIADTVRGGPWKERLEAILIPREWPVHPPEVYHEILRDHVTTIDLWETDYIQVLSGPNPVAEWTQGSALRPFIDALADGGAEEFLSEYRERVAHAYPPQRDGSTLFPFRRLFFVATR